MQKNSQKDLAYKQASQARVTKTVSQTKSNLIISLKKDFAISMSIYPQIFNGHPQILTSEMYLEMIHVQRDKSK